MPRLNKLAKKQEAAGPQVVDDEHEQYIGVQVLPLAEAPPQVSKPPAEESKVAAEPEQALPDPKKKVAKKLVQAHKDDGAFNTYLFRVSKEVAPDSQLSRKAMITLNHMVSDKFEEIMREARELIICHKKGTITSKEVEAATKLLLRGELS